MGENKNYIPGGKYSLKTVLMGEGSIFLPKAVLLR